MIILRSHKHTHPLTIMPEIAKAVSNFGRSAEPKLVTLLSKETTKHYTEKFASKACIFNQCESPMLYYVMLCVLFSFIFSSLQDRVETYAVNFIDYVLNVANFINIVVHSE